MAQEQVVEQTAEQQQLESDSAFEAGYAGTRVEAPAPEPEQKEQQEETPPPEVKEAAETPPPDPMAEIKARLDSISTKLGTVDQLDHRFKSYEGRLGKINSTLETLAAAKAAAAAVAASPTQAQIDAAFKDPQEWEDLKVDFPDWAKGTAAMVDARINARLASAKQEPVDVAGIKTEINTALSADLEQRVAAAAAQAEEMAVVRIRHPGWKQTVQTPEFRDWYGKQAPEVQALAQSSVAEDAIRMLDSFAESRAKAEKDKQQKEANERRLRGAVQPKGQPAATPTTLTDEEAFELGYKSAG